MMSFARRVVVLSLFGLFVLTLVVRPVARFLPAGFTGNGFDARVLMFAVPGIVVLLAMLVVGLSLLRRKDTDREMSPGAVLAGGSELPGPDLQPTDESALNDETTVDRGDGWSGDRFLTGQGGTRNKGFEIEEQPPETDVDDHLRYLREQLDGENADAAVDDDSTDDGLDGEQSTSTDEAAEIPSECPQPYCGADWRTSGLLSRGASYERLSNGEQVRCRKCGGITTLE